MIDTMHADQLRQHGGFPENNGDGLIESVLARPRNQWVYTGENPPDLATLAAACGFGLAKNRGFRDDNTRIACMTMYVFLGLNGQRIVAEERAVVQLMRDVACGACSEDELTAWLRAHIERGRSICRA